MAVRKRDGSWTVDVTYRTPGGNVLRVRRASPVDSKRGAVAYERQVLQALLDGSWDVGSAPKSKTPTFEEFFAEFIAYYATQVQVGTVQNYASCAEHHLFPAFGNTPIDRIDARAIDGFSGVCLQKMSPASANNVLSRLSKVLDTARRWGVLDSVPEVRKAKVPTTTEDVDFLDFDECQRLLNHLKGTRWYALVLLAVRAGLRVGELCALSWPSVDFDRARIKVSKTYRKSTGWGLPKGGVVRELPLTADVVAALRELKASSEGLSVFGEGDGPLSHRVVAGMLEKAARELKMRHIHPHMLRHTCGSHASMRGVNLVVVQKWLGHASITTTRKYVHVTPQYHDEAAKLMNPDTI